MPCARACIDFGDHLRHASPIIFAGNLDVPDFDWNMRLSSDAQRFVDRGMSTFALVPHMGGVDSAELRGLRRQRDQFFGLGIRRGRILQGQSKLQQLRRAWHRAPAPSSVQVARAWAAVVVAQHHAPHLRSADVARQVDSHALLFEAREILRERSASQGRSCNARRTGRSASMMSSFSGASRTAFAGDFGGDALVNLRGQTRINQDGHLRLAQHVDKARRDHFPAASIVRLRAAPKRLPMAAIRPSRMPTSPEYQGEPVPSTMWPFVMTMSKRRPPHGRAWRRSGTE